jgi:hypothetical protein
MPSGIPKTTVTRLSKYGEILGSAKSIANMRTRKVAMGQDEFNEVILLETLRRFMLNADLSDRRISRLMGIEIETLRTLVAGTTNPRRESLNKIRSFLK